MEDSENFKSKQILENGYTTYRADVVFLSTEKDASQIYTQFSVMTSLKTGSPSIIIRGTVFTSHGEKWFSKQKEFWIGILGEQKVKFKLNPNSVTAGRRKQKIRSRNKRRTQNSKTKTWRKRK